MNAIATPRIHMNIPAFASGNGPLTMSSREIAELTGKRHDNVVRDIEKMLNVVKIDRLKFEGVYIDAKGEHRKCYNLPKNLTLNLVAGYRADMRLKIIDRWMELEGQVPPAPQFQLPQTFSEALRALADQTERNEALTAENKVLGVKADAFDVMFDEDGLVKVDTAHRLLKGRPEFRNVTVSRSVQIEHAPRWPNHNMPLRAPQKPAQWGGAFSAPSNYQDLEGTPRALRGLYKLDLVGERPPNGHSMQSLSRIGGFLPFF